MISRVLSTTCLRKGFSSATQMYQQMPEVQQANTYFHAQNMSSAAEHYRSAFDILSRMQNEDAALNVLTKQILSSYIWLGSSHKATQFACQAVQKVGHLSPWNKLTIAVCLEGNSQQSQSVQPQSQSKMNALYDAASQSYNPQVFSLFRQALRETFPGLCQWGHVKRFMDADFQPKGQNQTLNNNLSKHLDLNFCIMVCDILRGDTCSLALAAPLLTEHQKGEPGSPRIVQALLLNAILRTKAEKYLQAEGVLSFCKSKHNQHFKQDVLKANQQHILAQLLLSWVFAKLNRQKESQQLENEYGQCFDARLLVLQVLTQPTFLNEDSMK